MLTEFSEVRRNLILGSSYPESWLDSKLSLEERTVHMDESTEGRGFDVEETWVDGWDCTVVFDDEVVGGLEWEKLDQLRDNLAASEGITGILHEDREVFHLKVEDLDLSAIEGKVAEAVERTGIDHGDYSP
jgi:hypothetical protein